MSNSNISIMDQVMWPVSAVEPGANWALDPSQLNVYRRPATQLFVASNGAGHIDAEQFRRAYEQGRDDAFRAMGIPNGVIANGGQSFTEQAIVQARANSAQMAGIPAPPPPPPSPQEYQWSTAMEAVTFSGDTLTNRRGRTQVRTVDQQEWDS